MKIIVKKQAFISIFQFPILVTMKSATKILNLNYKSKL